MSYNLFLDDVRIPEDCVTYMHQRIGPRNPIYINETWIIARDFKSFVAIIEKHGNPKVISFDHDLAFEHYADDNGDGTWTLKDESTFIEKTGYDAAKWYMNWLRENGLPVAEIFIHSANPVGSENIRSVFQTKSA